MKELLQGLQIGPGARMRSASTPGRLDLRSRRTVLVVGLLVVLATLGLWRLRTAPIVVDIFTVTAGVEGPAPTLTAGGYARSARVVYVAARFVVAGPRVSLRAVETGSRDGEMVAVTAGLADGDRVVVSGVDRLGEGTPIRVR